MARLFGVAALIAEHLETPETQWSLGTFGAIAEFSRDRLEDVAFDFAGAALTVVTPRGGLRISPPADLRLFASEGIARLGWTQRVSLCLPLPDCAMHRRTVFTEIGRDDAPLREEDRNAILFDLGLGVAQADFCVRVADEAVAAELRNCVGRPVFDPLNPAMRIILAANPHRVFVSRVGRAEVYQPIPPVGDKSPDGPHTHVLPKLLQQRRTHAATEIVPDGFMPCAHFYPKNPIKDALGRERPFDVASHRAFQALHERHGAPAVLAIKTRVAELIEAGRGPNVPVANDRISRTAVRVALRQMRAAGRSLPALDLWLAVHDRADGGDEDDDDPAILGH